MGNELLLVVDVQNGFISDKTREVVPRISSLIESMKCSHCAFTQFVNAAGSPYERYLNWFRLKSENEQEIAQELRSHARTVFRKEIYSAVNDRFREYIFINKIDTVYICGIDTDCCVLASAIGIFELGIRPVVLAHYCASNGGPPSHAAGLLALGRLIGTAQIMSGEV